MKETSVKKGMLAEVFAIKILEERGIKCKKQTYKHEFDIKTQSGKRIDVKYASKKMKPKSQAYPYYSVSTRANIKNDCDFFLVFVGDLNDKDFFVIPRRDVPKTNLIRIHFPFRNGEKRRKGSKYEKYYRAVFYIKEDIEKIKENESMFTCCICNKKLKKKYKSKGSGNKCKKCHNDKVKMYRKRKKESGS